MNKSLINCDKLMFGALLGMVFFLPFSLALIDICQGTMILAWLFKCALQCKLNAKQCFFKDFGFISPGMRWSLIAIGLLILLTIPFSHYPALSIRKFFTRYLQQILLIYLVPQIVHSRKRLYGVLAMLSLALSFVIIDIMIQYICGRSIVHHNPLIFGRVSGPMNHPNDLGTLLVTVLPVVFVLTIICRRLMPPLRWWGAAAGSILFLLLVIALGMTSSRGAWISFVLSVATVCICLKSYKSTILTIFLFAVFFWVFGVHCLDTRIDIYKAPTAQGPAAHPSLTNPFGLQPGCNVFDLFMDSTSRKFYWGTAVGVIKHYPWFGCGYSAYVQTLRDLNVGHEEYPHNSLLHITAELGVVGLVLYGWFFTALFLQIKNTLHIISCERDLFLLGCGISTGLLAWSIHSLMDTAWASLQLSVLWWLFIGILLSLRFLLPNYKGEKPCL